MSSTLDEQRSENVARLASAAYRSDAELVTEYAQIWADIAIESRRPLESRIDTMISAREAAEAEFERCNRACEIAETWIIFAAQVRAGDVAPATLAETANTIRSMTGVAA